MGQIAAEEAHQLRGGGAKGWLDELSASKADRASQNMLRETF
jgi:hypothetical protein